MTCSVAAVNGAPVFSPPHTEPLPCNDSPEALILTMAHLHGGEDSPSTVWPRMAGSIKSDDVCSGPGKTCSTSASLITALKRKRPARIDIPRWSAAQFVSWGAVKEVEEEGEGFSVYCKKGRARGQMEDRYDAAVGGDGDDLVAFFGVFDGHGGKKVAEYVSKNLQKYVMDEIAKAGDGAGEVIEAIKVGYQRMDSEVCKQEIAGGACSVTALIKNDELIVSNAGDCRAVVSRGGLAEAITSDHRPSRQDERERIEQLGGFVQCRRGVLRLQGSLAVSRGFGDVHLKKWVIAEPETKILEIKPECEFLILASDGLWEKVSNQEAVDLARPLCVNTASLILACKGLADLSVSRGSRDDISVMIIQLRHLSNKNSRDNGRLSMTGGVEVVQEH